MFEIIVALIVLSIIIIPCCITFIITECDNLTSAIFATIVAIFLIFNSVVLVGYLNLMTSEEYAQMQLTIAQKNVDNFSEVK